MSRNVAFPESVSKSTSVTDTKRNVTRQTRIEFDLSNVDAESVLDAAMRSWVIDAARALRANIDTVESVTRIDPTTLGGRTRDPVANARRGLNALTAEQRDAIVAEIMGRDAPDA